jgi:transcriptional regulator with XRE-family HTH domain
MKQRTKTLNARQRLASQLRQRRKIFDLSQEALADLAGLHRTYVGSIERCERNVSIDNIEKLASALHTDIAELLAAPELTEMATSR